jgi:Zn-finger nucleic acid-binding protein
MNCPVCNCKVLLSVKHGVDSVYCPECNEVWSTKRRHKNFTKGSISKCALKNKSFVPENHISKNTNDHKIMDS